MGPPTESREKHETGHMLCFSPRPHGMDEREEDKRTEGFCTDTFERFSSFFVNGIDWLLEAPQEQVLFSVGFPIRDLKFYVIVC